MSRADSDRLPRSPQEAPVAIWKENGRSAGTPPPRISQNRAPAGLITKAGPGRNVVCCASQGRAAGPDERRRGLHAELYGHRDPCASRFAPMAPHRARLRRFALRGHRAPERSCLLLRRGTRRRRAGLRALLWAIDLHNRMAHLGLSLGPAFRGRGLGTDVVVALCCYGFTIRGLHRLQFDTLASNTAMIRAASRPGLCRRQARRSAWLDGDRRRGDPRDARTDRVAGGKGPTGGGQITDSHG